MKYKPGKMLFWGLVSLIFAIACFAEGDEKNINAGIVFSIFTGLLWGLPLYITLIMRGRDD